jgi:hypothetical protein
MPNGEVDMDRLYTRPYLVSEAFVKAPHLGHSQHLCDMADRGVALQVVKDLVKNPKFICKKCGRAAAKEVNLCEPVPL